MKILFLLSLVLIAGCNNNQDIEPKVEDRELLVVETQKFTSEGAGEKKLEFSGTLRASKSTTISFLKAGRIEKLYRDEGAKVSAGELLAVLDTRALYSQRRELQAQLAEARASSAELEAPPRRYERAAAVDQVEELQSRIKLTDTKLERRRRLFAKGAIPKENLDELVTQKESLMKQLQAAKNRVKDLEAGSRPQTRRAGRARVSQIRASLDSLNVPLQDSELRAPFSGRISRRLLDEGSIVAAGQGVLELVTAGRLEAELFLPPSRAQALVVGESLEVEASGESYSAKVKSILPRVDPQSGTQAVILQMPLAPTLSPGQLIRFELSVDSTEDGFWLPSSALVPGERGLFVCYTVEESPDEAGVFLVKKQALEILRTTGEKVFVRGTLQGSPNLITRGVNRVVPGQKVRLQ